MKDLSETTPEHAFRDLDTWRSLADVRDACNQSMTGTALRDVRSAFTSLEKKAGVDLSAVAATPAAARRLLSGLTPGHLDVSQKRLENIQSQIRRAVEGHGMQRGWIGASIELTPAWRALIDTVVYEQARWALNRLARYCSRMGIEPEAVHSEMLIGFQEALELSEANKDPATIRKRVITMWNRCHRDVPGWPGVRLSSPFKPEPYMFPLEAFPEGFQRDVEAHLVRLSTADPLDNDKPIRALRPTTLERHVFDFRRLGSALVREGVLPLEAVTGFDVFLDGDNFRKALYPFVDKSDDYILKMALRVREIGRRSSTVTAEKREEIERIIGRLNTTGGRQMGARNRMRLQQFDDPTIVRRLLNFPEEELARALKQKNTLRRAKGVERALAIALLINTGLRAKNLRSLRVVENLRRVGDRVFLELHADETKTHSDLTLELPSEVIRMLDLFLDEHRRHLPNSDGSWLFPGGCEGQPRSYSAMREAVSEPLRRYAGIELSPHLYRHIIAKIVAERAPEHLILVSRMLGHRSITITYQAYLGTEGPAAARRVADLMRVVAGEKK